MAVILTKKKDTTGAPAAGDLTNSAGGAELAVNTADKRLYTKDSGGNVVEVGTNPGAAVSFTAGTASAPAITTTGDTNTGIFFPAADTIAFTEGGVEAMRIDSSGNVGIGTSSPAYKLDVVGNTQIRGNISTDLQSISAWTSNTRALQLTTYGAVSSNDNIGTASLSANAYESSDNNWKRVAGTSAALYQASYTGAHVWYRTGSATFDTDIVWSESMRIDSSGNVGIGTSSPSTRLTVSGANTAARGQLSLVGASADARITLYTDSTFNGVFGAGSSGAYIGTESNTLFSFYTNATERARITSGGYFKASNDGSYLGSTGAYHELRSNGSGPTVIIASTNANQTDNTLQVDANRNTSNNTFYFISCYNRGADNYRLRIADSGNVTNVNGTYGTISDVKLKQDIVDAGSQWDDIKNLRFRKYRLKSDVEANPDAKPLLGLVAQEAELVSPGLIEEHRDTKQETKTCEVEKTREVEVTPAVLDEEGNVVEPAVMQTETYTETEEYTETVDLGTTTKSIKTSILYMKAVKALQEAMIRIEALEAQNVSLEARLTALETK